MKYVLSTMTGHVAYTFYQDAMMGGLPVVAEKILIQGGTGLPSLTSGHGELSKTEDGQPLWTANGVVTPVSDDKAERLAKHPVFMQHEAAGYVKILNTDIGDSARAVEKVVMASDMKERDSSAQLTPKTVKAKISANTPKISTGGENDGAKRI